MAAIDREKCEQDHANAPIVIYTHKIKTGRVYSWHVSAHPRSGVEKKMTSNTQRSRLFFFSWLSREEHAGSEESIFALSQKNNNPIQPWLCLLSLGRSGMEKEDDCQMRMRREEGKALSHPACLCLAVLQLVQLIHTQQQQQGYQQKKKKKKVYILACTQLHPRKIKKKKKC
jgi:hypothetical protein